MDDIKQHLIDLPRHSDGYTEEDVVLILSERHPDWVWQIYKEPDHAEIVLHAQSEAAKHDTEVFGVYRISYKPYALHKNLGRGWYLYHMIVPPGTYPFTEDQLSNIIQGVDMSLSMYNQEIAKIAQEETEDVSEKTTKH